jgi:hypothetical protein
VSIGVTPTPQQSLADVSNAAHPTTDLSGLVHDGGFRFDLPTVRPEAAFSFSHHILKKGVPHVSTLTVSEFPLATETPPQRLRRTAAAVRVSLHWWGVHRSLSTQQKEEVSAGYAADARFLTAGKKIIDTRHEAVRKLSSIKTRLGNYWRGLTLPFTEAGIRLIPQSDIEPFVHTMEGFRDELVNAEADLNAVYHDIKLDAQRRLGRLYDPSDYPSEVRQMFTVEWDFPSVEPPNYLMRIAPQVYEQERARVAARFDEAVRLAEQAFASEFAKLLSHLTERLSESENGERRIFRDSAVTNLGEFFERFRRLNVRSNPELDALVDQAQQLVRGVVPQDLREDNSLRRQVGDEMAKVQERVEGLIVEAPRRRIIRSHPSTGGNDESVG